MAGFSSFLWQNSISLCMIYHVFFVHSSMVVSVSVELILRRNFRYRTEKKEKGRGSKFWGVNNCAFFFFFFFFFGCSTACGVCRPGIRFEPCCSYGNARSLTHYARPGIEPASLGFQDAANPIAPQWGLLIMHFQSK